MQKCELKNNNIKKQKKPLWLKKAEQLNPVDFIRWMQIKKGYQSNYDRLKMIYLNNKE